MTPIVTIPALSAAIEVEASNVTEGPASSSVIVSVCAVVAPADAFDSDPVVIDTTTVSSASSRASADTVKLNVPVVAPALIVKLPSARS